MNRNGIFSLAFHTLFVCFVTAPLLVVCLVAFTPQDYLSLPTTSLSLRWFAALLERRDFIEGFKVSAGLAALSATVSLALATPFAIAVVRHRFIGRNALLTLLQSPLMIPSAVLGIAFLRFLSQIGLYGSFTGLLIGHVIIITPVLLRIIMSACTGLDQRVEHAAISLGASRVTTFRRIFVPLVLPGLASGWILAFITSFDEVTMTVFVASPENTTLPVQLFLFIQDNINPLVAAASASLIAMAMVVMVIIDRLVGLERIFSGPATK